MGLFKDFLTSGARVFQAQAPVTATTRTNLAEVQQAFLSGRPDPSSSAYMRPPFSHHSLTYTCMVIIAQAMSAVPFKLYKKKSDKAGNPIPVLEHPLIDLLNDPFPGVYADFTQFIETIALYLESTGNAFILPDLQNSKGIPRSLMVLGLQHVKPLVDKDSGRLVGWSIKLGRQETQVGPFDLIHMKYTNPDAQDQILGIGPMQAAMTAINADFARQVYDAAFFSNGARLSLALTYHPPDTRPEDQFLTQEQVYQVRESFYDSYAGMRNAGKIAVLHGGFELKELGMSQKDMDFIEGRRWSRQEIAAVFRVPVPLLNDFQFAGLGREGVSVAQRMLYENNVAPKIQRLTSLFQKFLVETYAPGHIGGFDVDSIPAMREDVTEKVEIAFKFFQMGFPINQINKLLKLGFDPVEWGDDWLVPGGMVPARQLAGPEAFTMNFDGILTDPSLIDAMETQKQIEKGPDVVIEDDEEDSKKEEKRSARNILLSNARLQQWERFLSTFALIEAQYKKRLHRFIYDIRVEVKKNITGFYKTRGTRIMVDDIIDGIMFDIPAAQRLIQEFSRRYFEQAIRAGASDVVRLTGGGQIVGLESSVAQQLLETKLFLVRRIPETIAENLQATIRSSLQASFDTGEALSAQAVRLQNVTNEVFTFTANRARAIARTEILSAVNGGKMSEYVEQGISQIEWLSAGDEVVRDSHQIDGEIITIGEVFSNGLRFPCDPEGSAEEVINCRCTSLSVEPDVTE
jgi:HK97 family phage portal protein